MVDVGDNRKVTNKLSWNFDLTQAGDLHRKNTEPPILAQSKTHTRASSDTIRAAIFKTQKAAATVAQANSQRRMFQNHRAKAILGQESACTTGSSQFSAKNPPAPLEQPDSQRKIHLNHWNKPILSQESGCTTGSGRFFTKNPAAPLEQTNFSLRIRLYHRNKPILSEESGCTTGTRRFKERQFSCVASIA